MHLQRITPVKLTSWKLVSNMGFQTAESGDGICLHSSPLCKFANEIATPLQESFTGIKRLALENTLLHSLTIALNDLWHTHYTWKSHCDVIFSKILRILSLLPASLLSNPPSIWMSFGFSLQKCCTEWGRQEISTKDKTLGFILKPPASA